MGAGTRAAVRRRARSVPGCADRVRGPRRPPRRREHRGRHAALPWRSRGGEGSVRIHALSSLRGAPGRSPNNRTKRARRRPAPCRGAAVVTFAERVHAVAKKGFTERQAGFLVTVMLHSGVCVRRQYCVYARIVRGQKVHDFFASLVAKNVRHVVLRGASTSPHLPRAQQDRSTPRLESQTTATANPSRSPAP